MGLGIEQIVAVTPPDVHETVSQMGYNFSSRNIPDSGGRFVADGPPAGEWRVRLHGTSSFPDLHQELVVTQGTRDYYLSFDLPRRSAFRGRLLYGGRRPLPFARLYLASQRTESDENGVFLLEGMQPRRHRFAMRSWTDDQELYYALGSIDLSRDRDCDVIVGGPRTVTLAMRGVPADLVGSELSVSLVHTESESSGVFVGGETRKAATVALERVVEFPYPRVRAKTTTDTVEFPAVSPGTYGVHARFAETRFRETIEVANWNVHLHYDYMPLAEWEVLVSTVGNVALPESIKVQAPAQPEPSDFDDINEYIRVAKERANAGQNFVAVNENLRLEGGRARLQSSELGEVEISIRATGFKRYRTRIDSQPGSLSYVEVVLQPDD